MLSKSKGQTLRVAAVMHILFQIQQTDPEQAEIVFKDEISEKALQAANSTGEKRVCIIV